jgi:hypothetical protein
MSATNLKSAAGTNATVLYRGPALVRGGVVTCQAAYPVFLKFYDLARPPQPATDVPNVKIAVPAGATGGVPVTLPRMSFLNGLAYAITKLVGDQDTTAVVADDLNGTLDWYPRR